MEQFKQGMAVEVYCRSLKEWVSGEVIEVCENFVTIIFTTKDGQVCRKRVHESSKHVHKLRPEMVEVEVDPEGFFEETCGGDPTRPTGWTFMAAAVAAGEAAINGDKQVDIFTRVARAAKEAAKKAPEEWTNTRRMIAADIARGNVP